MEEEAKLESELNEIKQGNQEKKKEMLQQVVSKGPFRAAFAGLVRCRGSGSRPTGLRDSYWTEAHAWACRLPAAFPPSRL